MSNFILFLGFFAFKISKNIKILETVKTHFVDLINYKEE